MLQKRITQATSINSISALLILLLCYLLDGRRCHRNKTPFPCLRQMPDNTQKSKTELNYMRYRKREAAHALFIEQAEMLKN